MKVVFSRCESYSDVKEALKEVVDRLGGIERFVRKGERVLVKPNLLSPHTPEHAVTTHPDFVRAVCELIEEAGGKVIIGDSPGMQGIGEELFERTGIKDLGYPCVLFDKERTILKNGWLLTSVLEKVDRIINLPKLKTHTLTTLTLGVKNLYGLIPGVTKKKLHTKYPDPFSFSHMLLELYFLVKPDLTLLDGIWGMEGNGPSAGNPVRPGIVAGSPSALALDVEVAKRTGAGGFPLKRIAERKKILPSYTVEGDFRFRLKLPGKRWYHLLPSWAGHILSRLYRVKPGILPEKCTGCGICMRNCPAGAIEIKDTARINYSRCIGCMSCQELCPFGAIVPVYGLIKR